MALSTHQINSIYLAILDRLPTSAELNIWTALDATSGDNAVYQGIVQSAPVLNADYPIVQIIQLVQGSVPTLAQLQGWVNYVNGGGSLTSVVDAFSASTTFIDNFNSGVPFDPKAPVTTQIMTNILLQVNGTPPLPSTVQTWVNTGLSTDAIMVEFALGDQWAAKTQTFIQNYLTHIAVTAAGPSGAAAPSGALFGVPPVITITDNTAGNVPPEQTSAGNTIVFTVSETGLAGGTQATWQLTGTAVSANEIVGPTTGQLTFDGVGSCHGDGPYHFDRPDQRHGVFGPHQRCEYHS